MVTPEALFEYSVRFYESKIKGLRAVLSYIAISNTGFTLQALKKLVNTKVKLVV